MAIGLNNNGITSKLSRNLENAQKIRSDAMEKMATGKVFTSQDPRPANRALSDQLEFRIRSLNSAKKNINDAVSMLQTADSAMSEVNNIIIRMKELNISAATTTVTDRERRFLFIEFDALHDELNRIAKTTVFNGIPLLNGEDERTPEQLIFRVDDPAMVDGSKEIGDDLNVIRFNGLKGVVATTSGLGIGSARDLLSESSENEGVSLESARGILIGETEEFATVYDDALNRLATQRAVFGAMQSRLNHARNFVDVYEENLTSAKSVMSDTDYSREVVRLAQSNILMQASSGLLAQSNFDSNVTLTLLSSVTR